MRGVEVYDETEARDLIADLEARSRRVETPCGESAMVWRIWGEGEPLVLGHGAQGGWSHWIRNIDALAERRMLIAADLPGHGESAAPANSDHETISAALAAGLREILGRQGSADLAGFSFGGVAFAHLAAFFPGVVRRLILIGCGGLDTPHGHIDLRRVSGLEGEERREAIRVNLLGLMLHHRESADELAMYMQMWNGRRARLKNAADLVLPDKLLRILPRVSAPVGAIWGEHDRPHPDPDVQRDALLSVKPDASFRVVEGAGHWAMYERAHAFDRALLAMLDEDLPDQRH